MNDTILQARDIVKDFAGFRAVDGFSLALKEGSIHALIGPNGAGKTTCFNLMTKFLRPTSGHIHFMGKEITDLGPAQVARMGLVRSFQISAVFPQLSVVQNVRMALQRERGGSYDFWRSESLLDRYNERALELLRDVGLAGYEEAVAATLPYGRKRALEIATTLALDPKVMLLDEPTAGMAGEDVDRIVSLIRRVRNGRTILLVEHNLSVVEGLCDRVTVLARGVVLAEGTYSEIADHPEVVAAYLGSAHV